MTLIEIIVACFVLGVCMTLVGETIVSAYQSHDQQVAQMKAVRDATTALDMLSREMRLCDQLYVPDPKTAFVPGATCTPGTGNATLVFRYTDSISRSDIPVGYAFDSARREITRKVYLDSYDPRFLDSNTVDPAHPPVVIATSVQNLQLTNTAPHVAIQLIVEWRYQRWSGSSQLGKSNITRLETQVNPEGLLPRL